MQNDFNYIWETTLYPSCGETLRWALVRSCAIMRGGKQSICGMDAAASETTDSGYVLIPTWISDDLIKAQPVN